MIKRGRGRPKKIVQKQVTSKLDKVGDAIEAFVNTHDFTEAFMNNLMGKVIYELRVYNNCRNPEVMERITDLLTVMSGYADSLPKEEYLD